MKIEEIYPNFAQKGLELTPGQKFCKIPDGNFDLYGVFYDAQLRRFLRMPQSVADTVNPTVAL